MTEIAILPAKSYVFIDFEATCDRKGFPKKQMEIIEFAGVITDKHFSIIDEFSRFVKPKLKPRLTKFCTELTTIRQSDVDLADPFSKVLNDFREFKKLHDPIFCSWGDYDRNQLGQDCELHQVSYPFDEKHVNIKKECAKALNIKPKGIGGMLRHLGLKFEGTPHRGIDDVKNIIRIVQHISHMKPNGGSEKHEYSGNQLQC